MREPLVPSLLGVLCGLLLTSAGAAQELARPSVQLELSPRVATVGDPLELILTVDLPAEARPVPRDFGPELGPFSILAGGWEAPVERDGSRHQVWRGTVAAYQTGKLELPPIAVRVERDGKTQVARTEPLEVTIRSVLPPQGSGEDPELADLKAPASIAADYSAVWTAGWILLLLLLLSLLVWWLVRRYADRLAAKPTPRDPFQRVPPHVWVYRELQRLLERRLAEEGKVDLFYTEVAWILKRYLSGRYRIELMERTTSEVALLLKQAGAPAEPSQAARSLLERCDRVKFAREMPHPGVYRAAVEEAYGIVDATRPAEQPAVASERGAA